MNRTNQIHIPDHVIKNIIELHGEKGTSWISDLEKFISYYEKEWQFKAEKCFPDAQFNVVLDVTQNNGVSAVFKCCLPNKEFKTENLSLKHYDGDGAAKLLKSDIDNGAMLIEKITPGTSLESLSNIEAETQYAIDVCRKLHTPIKNDQLFPSLENWFTGFDRLYKKFNNTSGPFDEKLIKKAKKISRELLSSQSQPILLHGDLHYANLILNQDHYVAIDPKGVIGESAFEIPLPRVSDSITEKELFYRLDCFITQSQFDQKRIYSWVFCKAVLAAWWTVEDSGSFSDFTKRFLRVAKLIESEV